jgi:flavorubredoxin
MARLETAWSRLAGVTVRASRGRTADLKRPGAQCDRQQHHEGKTPMHSTVTKSRLQPTRVADETFIIHDHTGEGIAPVLVPINSLVIRGAEPIVVDTGFADNREHFHADVFGLVEPEDIRWLFVSHDDVDHTGNVNELMRLAPNATLVINWFMLERMGATLDVPLHRMRWVADGESFEAGDRRLHAVRPPVFDSPTTRGLFDPTTGFYWGADSFATPMLEPTTDVVALDAGFWHDGMAMFHQYVSPWYSMVDRAAFQRSVDRVESLGVTSIAGCHTPAIRSTHVETAFRQIRTFLDVTVPAEPGQDVLDQMVSGSLVGA